jgi:predicted acyl esterase
MNTRVKKRLGKKVLIPLAAILLLIAVLAIYRKSTPHERISEFDKYQGYSQELYDGSKRTSDYLTLSDGTQLAYDLFLPTKEDLPTDQLLPTLFKYTPYNRTWTIFDKDGKAVLCDLMPVWYCEPMLRFRAWVMPNGRGQIKDAVGRTPWLAQMLHSGYAVLVVDRPAHRF